MTSYETSKGDRLVKGKIDRNIRHAKAEKDRRFKNDNGFLFCEKCNRSDKHLDKSHIISVKYAQDTCRTELAWSLTNIRLECRDCHNQTESMGNLEREKEFERYNGFKPPEIKKRYKVYD